MKHPIRRISRWTLALVLTGVATSAFALTTVTITAAALSPDCLAYRVVGICYWLYCDMFGCSVRTSTKVRHYVPDAVVSSYSDTGLNPWIDVAFMSPPNHTSQGGGSGTTNEKHENNLAIFKNADVIGHPAGTIFNQFVTQTAGYVCAGAGTPFTPYLLSVFDPIGWRYDIPEALFPESLTPGLREVGSRATLNLWGNVYPRGGFLHQVNDFEASAVVAQRAGDIVTRPGQIHVYQPLLPSPALVAAGGYWPAGPLIESIAETGKWQQLTPILSPICATFPNFLPQVQATAGAYAWALWRPYSCCKREGEAFLFSVDFAP
jgi:integrating conjugative element protein (TIGR03756 family)